MSNAVTPDADPAGSSSAASALVPESVYYARHMRLPGFTQETQDRLRRARILIVGVGGLGCPAALYLAGAGVGVLGLCDADTVSATNLHRQVLFNAGDIGQKKVDVAAARLSAQNPHIKLVRHDRFADAAMLEQWVEHYDLVLDGTDNFDAKYVINDACAKAGVPLVYGSIFQYEGQVSVFHLPTDKHPDGLSYRDVYPDAPPSGLSQNCGEAGVVGVLPGIIGTLQANEAIKVLTGLGEPLSGKLLTFDALTAETRTLKLKPRKAPRNAVTPAAPAEITFEQLSRLLRLDRPPVLVDVRELHERERFSLGGVHIPLMKLASRVEEVDQDRDVVLYCQSGVRSGKAALFLRSLRPGQTVLSLQGGVMGANCTIP